ncbi:MAG: site-specific integrase [Elusimicrobiota bacterium]|nr:site-specific integrase [Endomicrobiia bacterium]MDW8166168.1 site-specific integrase [Elusimicrobiota bacterium]
MPRYYIQKELFKVVEIDDIVKYIAAANDTDFLFFFLTVYLTGLRSCDVKKLRKENFQLRKNLLTITTKVSKGGGVANMIFNIKKVPFARELYLYVVSRNDDVIFRRSVRHYRRILQRLNEKIYGNDKSKWITFHYLRHSRITFLARLGATPEELKSWTGHKTSAFEEYIRTRKVLRFATKIK